MRIRCLCFFIFCTFYVYYSNAQTTIGIKFGTNLSRAAFEPSVQQQQTLTYNAGIVFKHFEEKHAGIQLEINFSQKGWKEIKDSVHSYSRKMNYVEVPFMSHFYFGSEKSNLFLNLGPYVGYDLFANETLISNDTITTQNYKFTSADNRFDLGLAFGVGIKYESVFGVIQLEGRYAQSISDFASSINASGVSTAKNQVISISLAYLINYKQLRKKRKLKT